MRSRSSAARPSIPPVLGGAPPTTEQVQEMESKVAETVAAASVSMEPRGSIAPKLDELGSKVDADAADREAAQRRARAEAPKTPSEVRDAVDKLSMGRHARIVDALFDMPDPMEEYLAIKAALSFGGRASSLSYGQLVDALDEAQQIAERGSRLMASAKVTYDAFHLDAEVIRGALREQAVDDLQRQKAEGKRSKAITNDDITAVMAAAFPDEYRDLEMRAGKARRMVAAIEQLYDRACARAGDLRAMVQRTREV